MNNILLGILGGVAAFFAWKQFGKGKDGTSLIPDIQLVDIPERLMNLNQDFIIVGVRNTGAPLASVRGVREAFEF